MSEQKEFLVDTLPKLLLSHYRKYGDSKIALREKDRGIWVKYSWSDYFSNVERLTMGFLELGLEKNDKLAIIGENKAYVYWCELASLVCGAPVVGIFPDCTPLEIKYLLEHSDSRLVVCQDQEQVDKLLSIKDEIPKIKKIIYWEEKGMWKYHDPLLITIKEMTQVGHKRALQDPGLFEEMISKTKGDDIAFFFYSSGTKGRPQAALHTHQNAILMAERIDRRYPVRETDDSVSFLPIAWIVEQLFNVTYSLFKGFTVNFPEGQEAVQENIRDVGPQILFLSPRLWEEYIKTIRVKMADAIWLSKLCFNTALKVGYRVADDRMKGRRIGLGQRLFHSLADKVVFRPLRDRLGLSRIRLAHTSGTAISPEAIRYFQAVGVPLIQIYVSSECGVPTMHPYGQIKAETCGTPLENCEIKVSEQGEIWVKSPFLFKGYYKEPEKRTKAMEDGWYHTGDFGRLDENGYLIIMDRMEDLQETAGGRAFSPQLAEMRLRISPYIRDALVIGRKEKDYAVALVNIDYSNVGKWAEVNHVPYTTFLDLSQKEGVIGLIKKEIESLNNELVEWVRIKRFINLHKEFDPDEGEFTRTRKVRRDFVTHRYKELVDALFSDKRKIDITASVDYRDGSQGEIRSSVSINRLNE